MLNTCNPILVVVSAQCTEARQRALLAIKKRELLHLGVFVPKCNPDGSFSQIQCLKASRVCWCVDSIGTELAGTRVRQRTPSCPSKFDTSAIGYVTREGGREGEDLTQDWVGRFS
jgi:hypothetical protein